VNKAVGMDYFDEAYWRDGTKSGYRNYTIHWPIHRAIGEMLFLAYGPWHPEMKILDWGGAMGAHAAWLAEMADGEAYLVDGSIYAVNHRDPRVKEAHALDLGAHRLPWSDKFFDFVLAIEVMEHIYEPEVPFALSEMYRVMKPNARVYSSIATEAGFERNHDLSHQTMHPISWWEDKIREAGFILEPAMARKVLNTEVQHVYLAKHMKWNVVAFKRPG